MASSVSQVVDRVMHKFLSARSVAYFWPFLARAEMRDYFVAVNPTPAAASSQLASGLKDSVQP
jgi:hypothetical protein